VRLPEPGLLPWPEPEQQEPQQERQASQIFQEQRVQLPEPGLLLR
jgi:hypothetical protein